MATEFIIKKGLSTVLFDETGACRIPQEKLIENGWYLTTDTAEVYVALRRSENLELIKINDCNIDVDIDVESFDERITALENESKIHTYAERSQFPTHGKTHHLYVALDEQATYICTDEELENSYLCIGDADGEDYDVICGGSAKD